MVPKHPDRFRPRFGSFRSPWCCYGHARPKCAKWQKKNDYFCLSPLCSQPPPRQLQTPRPILHHHRLFLKCFNTAWLHSDLNRFLVKRRCSSPPSVPPRLGGARAAARPARSRKADEHERGGVHRASRGDFAQASSHARTHAGGYVGGRSLCLARLPRAWAHADRQRHARAQHAEAARFAAAQSQRPSQPPTGGGLSWWLLPLRGGHGRGLRRFAAVMVEVFAPSWWSRRRSFLHRHENNAKIASRATSAFFITGTCLGFAPLRGTCAARRKFRRNRRK